MVKKSFIYDHDLIEYIHGKISNYIWQYVDIISCKMEGVENNYELFTGKKYEEEFKIFDISDGDKILFIGCGQYPITAIILARLYDVNIIAIDKNPKAIKLAKSVIHKKNLEDKIIIEEGDGVDYPVDAFDVVILGELLFPKKLIYNHVFGSVKPGTKIILRLNLVYYNSMSEYINAHRDFSIYKTLDRTVGFLGLFDLPFKQNSFKCLSLCLIKKK